MNPSIKIGDIVISIPTPSENIATGDIVVFNGDSGIITHRVIGFEGTDCFITKGDANKDPDPLWACNESIVGKVVFSIPWIGYPLVYLLEYSGSYSNMISFMLSLLSLIYVSYIVKEVVSY
jgi:signal peptidase I, archaeal type